MRKLNLTKLNIIKDISRGLKFMFRRASIQMGAGASNLTNEWIDKQSETMLDKDIKNDTVTNLVFKTKVKATKDNIANKMEVDDRHQEKDEDTISMDSKDSDDTDVLELRITKYRVENRQAMQKDNMVPPAGRSDAAIPSTKEETNMADITNKPLGLIGKCVKFEDKNVGKDRCKSANDEMLARKMPKYLLEKRQRMQNANLTQKHNFPGNYGKNDTTAHNLSNAKDTVHNTGRVGNDAPDLHEQEKMEAFNVVNTNAAYDKAKYNQTHESTSSVTSAGVHANTNATNVNNSSTNSMNDKCLTGSSNYNGTSFVSNDQKLDSFGQFEEFKRKVGVSFKRPKSVANKQTLILTKVGTKFQLVTVPAYLPNQRLYRSTSFVKNYIPLIPVVRKKSKCYL